MKEPGIPRIMKVPEILRIVKVPVIPRLMKFQGIPGECLENARNSLKLLASLVIGLRQLSTVTR